MKLICPSCGAIHSAESWQNDADARQCMQTISMLPGGVAERSLNYLALFRPASGRGLRWKTALKILTELAVMAKTGHIQSGHSPARPAPPKIWAAALTKITENPPRSLPLKSHGYLKTIVYDLADTEDRETEKKKNQAERNGTYQGKGTKHRAPTPEPERISMDKVQEIIQKNFKNRKTIRTR